MVNWIFPFRYSTEDFEIISEAIGYTKKALHHYYSQKFAGASEVTRKIVDNVKGEIVKELNDVWAFISDKERPAMGTDLDRRYFFIPLGSALNLYLLHLDREIMRFDLPELKTKRMNIASQLETKIYQELDIHKYDEFYVTEPEITPNHLFFSYNKNDKEIVGQISEILEVKYGYTVFRAHDTIPGGKIWREKLKENLTKCEGLVAYVTENFLPSSYAHQECGWVMGRNRPIFPLFLTDKKPGLLEEWQGKPIEGPPDPSYIAELINDAFKKPT
jgi:hypothetical protein